MLYIEKRNASAMENHLLKYLAFVRTVDTGSFTRAAESLNYAQSSVSKMIGDLEREWGVALLERGRGGVCLTSAGEGILPLVRTVLNDQLMLAGHIDRLNGMQTGMVRIGTFASVAINWLPEVFAEFQKAYPGIEYEMLMGDYDEVARWIDEGRVDCGFLRLPAVRGLDALALKRDEYKVVLPCGHPLAERERIDIHELDGLPFLLLEHGGKTEVTELLEKSGVHPKIRFTTWEDYAIMAMAERGLGVGILPELILQRIPYRIEIRPLAQPYYRQIGLAMKDRRRLSPAAQSFVSYLKPDAE